MTDAIHKAAHLVRQARHIVVLSGAGLSADSGIPTFRDAQTGLWERFNPQQLATEEAFRENPALVWTWYLWRAALVRSVAPNAGHQAIGVWQQHVEKSGGTLKVVTQNVDDLHERGGATAVSHLHGSLLTYRCLECAAPAVFDPTSTGVLSDDTFSIETLIHPARCTRCAVGVLRPNVVWFEESLPSDAFDAAVAAVRAADVILVVGTSGLVQPAAALPALGQQAGARVIEVNPMATSISAQVDVFVQHSAAIALPQILSE